MSKPLLSITDPKRQVAVLKLANWWVHLAEQLPFPEAASGDTR